MDEKKKTLLWEFLRYAVVGGISAVCDMAVNYAALYWIFGAGKDDRLLVAVSVALGFLVGLAVNYILSDLFVFRSETQRKRGRTVKAAALYVLVGVIGFGLTEGLTIFGTFLIGDSGFWYLLLSCLVKGLVLIWNYAGRKIFVYHGE